LLFDQVGVLIELEGETRQVRRTLPIDAVDSARPPGRGVLFTPRFAATPEPPAAHRVDLQASR